MPLSTILKPLAFKLLDASRSGRVVWQEAAEPSTFLVSLGDHAVVITKMNDLRIRLVVRTAEDKMIEASYVTASEPDYLAMTELFALARRSALGVDQILKAISDELDKPGTIGAAKDPGKE